jgi:hypothetical protein
MLLVVVVGLSGSKLVFGVIGDGSDNRLNFAGGLCNWCVVLVAIRVFLVLVLIFVSLSLSLFFLVDFILGSRGGLPALRCGYCEIFYQ